MTYSNTPQTDISQRPDRIKLLAELPRETFEAINRDLGHVPDWERYFIMNNPVSWPSDMRTVMENYLPMEPAGS